MHDDIASKCPCRSLPERHMRRKGPAEILLDNRVKSFIGVNLKGLTGFDLMTGDADIHGRILLLL